MLETPKFTTRFLGFHIPVRLWRDIMEVCQKYKVPRNRLIVAALETYIPAFRQFMEENQVKLSVSRVVFVPREEEEEAETP